MKADVPREKLRTIEMIDLKDKPGAQEPAAPQAAPAEIPLSIEECRALALQYNLDLQVELINPTLAQQAVSKEEAKFETLLFGSVQWDKKDSPTETPAISGSKSESTSSRLGVRQPLSTGGELSAELPISEVETNNPAAILNPSYRTNVLASVSQPLLRNAGPKTNTHSIRVAKYNALITEADTKLRVMSVIADIDRFYWRLYAARRLLEVRKQEYDLAVQQLEQARRFVKQGVKAEVEVIRAESGVAEKLDAIIRTEGDVQDRQRELKRAINKPGLPLDSPTVVVPSTLPNPVKYNLDGPRLARQTLHDRMEMLKLEIQLAQDRSSIDFARNQTLPLLNLVYRYGVNGLGGSYEDALRQLGDKDFEDHSIGVTAEIPLGNEAAQSDLRKALYTRVQRIATRAQQEAQVRQEVLQAVTGINTNYQRILAARQSAILAARTLEAEKRQFELGLRTSTDVLDAQTKLADAQSKEVSAISDYQISQVDLAVATGTLIGASKVRWEPIKPDLSEGDRQ